MCGICGDLYNGAGSISIEPVQRMLQVLEPRGPDGQGVLVRNRAVLGHRRLKIIDLSEASQQPMVDSQLGLSVVYNGAIYNYPELRKELIDKGYSFFSHGDTEVILKAYHAWGLDFVTKLNGMFAFALYERDTGRVILGRDRLGIKPLYYSEQPGRFCFASTLPALLKAGGVDTRIDPVALNYYLSFHSVVPAPHTILTGVKKLPPATLMIIDADGKSSLKKYWDLQFNDADTRDETSFEAFQEQTLDVMRRAVKRRMVADVPVGVLLSGGLDSSLIVGLLAEQGQSDLQTFSIGFETVGEEKGDEFQYSDIIVDHFKTRHHKLFIDSSKALPELIECVRAMSEPMVSHDNVGFYLLSREVSKHLKVVQSGQGADEVFGGYHWYPPLLESTQPLDDYARVFFDRDFEEYGRVIEPSLVSRDYAREFVKQHFDLPGARHAVDKALRLDSTIMLVDDPVKRVDNHTMASSLEARVPFLDHEVVEFAARIPPQMKIKDGGKYVLKEAARKIIPPQVIDRPKGYFPMPALKYLRGDFLELARNYATNETTKNRGIYNQDYVAQLLKEPEKHITPLQGSKLWQLSLLEFWLQTHGI